MQLYENIQNKITQEIFLRNDLQGILLMGSVACGCATAGSDLDIMVLCDEDKFEVRNVDDIMVEIIFTTFHRRVELLENNAMEVYHFLHSKILYDMGKLTELMNLAQYKYEHYIPSGHYLQSINHWLESTRLKLMSSLIEKDDTKIAFYASTNAWKVLEGIWLINHKPIPPSSSVLRFRMELTIIPDENWFEKLFTRDRIDAQYMLRIIDWILAHIS
jgi:predicted nucleotidyltransferase